MLCSSDVRTYESPQREKAHHETASSVDLTQRSTFDCLPAEDPIESPNSTTNQKCSKESFDDRLNASGDYSKEQVLGVFSPSTIHPRADGGAALSSTCCSSSCPAR